MIYWDYNAGAPLLPEVQALLATAFAETAGNPSSVHQVGRRARKRLDAAREAVAQRLGALPREIVFTGSGSEAAALAVLGAFRARKDSSRRKVVTTGIEHPCVLGAATRLEQDGATVVRVPCGPDGVVRLDDVLAELTPDTALCSVMWVNNETGCIQPAPDVARACMKRGIVFHCDAVQAVGKLPATLRECPADLLSFSAHKLGGPAGVGVLVNRRGVPVAALSPGHQEDGRRGGTPSTALAEALALALGHAFDAREATVARVGALRDRFEREVLAALPGTVVNGAGAPRVANTSNLRFTGVDGEALLIALDLRGICVSSGAACASGSLSPSHVLKAMGLDSAQAQASLRFSLGEGSTDDEVTRVVAALVEAVPAARDA
ncbi:MAG: cysteine desulfurase family protein [Myxococcota bacterium]